MVESKFIFLTKALHLRVVFSMLTSAKLQRQARPHQLKPRATHNHTKPTSAPSIQVEANEVPSHIAPTTMTVSSTTAACSQADYVHALLCPCCSEGLRRMTGCAAGPYSSAVGVRFVNAIASSLSSKGICRTVLVSLDAETRMLRDGTAAGIPQRRLSNLELDEEWRFGSESA